MLLLHESEIKAQIPKAHKSVGIVFQTSETFSQLHAFFPPSSSNVAKAFKNLKLLAEPWFVLQSLTLRSHNF